jgi:hypothetical protein
MTLVQDDGAVPAFETAEEGGGKSPSRYFGERSP